MSARMVGVRAEHDTPDGLLCPGPIPVAVVVDRGSGIEPGGYVVEDAPDVCPECKAAFTAAEQELLAERAIGMAWDLDRERRGP